MGEHRLHSLLWWLMQQRWTTAQGYYDKQSSWQQLNLCSWQHACKCERTSAQRLVCKGTGEQLCAIIDVHTTFTFMWLASYQSTTKDLDGRTWTCWSLICFTISPGNWTGGEMWVMCGRFSGWLVKLSGIHSTEPAGTPKSCLDMSATTRIYATNLL